MSGVLNDDTTNQAMVSYCDGLTGWFAKGTETYNIESIHDTDDVEIVAIAQKPLTTIIDDVLSNNITLENGQFDQMRQKRAIEDTDVYTIETVVVLDADYIAGLIERGYTTNESMTDFMTLLWMGVKAEWAKSEQLGKYIEIAVKEIVLYHTNPDWYNPPAHRITDDTILAEACINADNNGKWKDYDHIHWFTTTTTSTLGTAYRNDICEDRKKCAVSTGFNPLDYSTAAHELGHCMGMSHDIDVGCAGNTALMGYTVKSGWSSCSRLGLYFLLMNKAATACLLQENVNKDDIGIAALYPGMVYNDDEICGLLYGDDYKYMDVPGSDPYTCVEFLCVNVNRASSHYGVSFHESKPIPGRYCGDEKICSWLTVNSVYQCVGWDEAEFNSSDVVKIEGGWTEWSEESACTRTCGTGLQYRQRFCTNPRPLNTAGCEGRRFDITKCNTQPCPDDAVDESNVILQRAGEICTFWKNNNLYELINKNSSHYLTTGSAFSSVDSGQCEVLCDTIESQKAAKNERHGLMPPGTTCYHASLSSDGEKLRLPRWSGMTSYCLHGSCEFLDCTNMTGDQRNDGCGVCGGDNSTCQPFDDVYDATLDNGVTETIVVIPANATLIQFYFTYQDMKKYFLELVMPNSDTKVISSSTLDTTNQPASFAGTYWYYLRSQQYLYAYGPTNQAVHVQVKNSGNANNTGIHYGYSLPPAAKRAACTGQCQNGGTWNQALCSCDCAVGFYGVDCSDTCKKYCKNSQPFATSGCKCNCTGRTYVLNDCNCRYPFQGPDCNECKITKCLNGGTFNSTECRCHCPINYGGLDCSGPCEDANGDTALCETNKDNGWCEKKNEQMERDCYKTCGLCVAGTATPSTTKTTTTQTTTQEGSKQTTTQKGSSTGSGQTTPSTTQTTATSKTTASSGTSASTSNQKSQPGACKRRNRNHIKGDSANGTHQK
ncbi:ADAM metallopeptidase with thrombospondin type 1 motif 17 [Mactra antiquata]